MMRLAETSQHSLESSIQACHSEGAFAATEESRLTMKGFFAEFILSEAEGLSMTQHGDFK
jgi:hypothetical protein